MPACSLKAETEYLSGYQPTRQFFGHELSSTGCHYSVTPPGAGFPEDTSVSKFVHKADGSVGNTAVSLPSRTSRRRVFYSHLVIMISDAQTRVPFTYLVLLFVRNGPSIT